MTDDMIIEQYCSSPQAVIARYRDLMIDGKMVAVTPTELAAILIRISDGTINKIGALRVIDVLESRNRVFVQFVNKLLKDKTNEQSI